MFAYVFVVILLIIFKIRGIGHKKQLVLASIRMSLQLVIAGYLLSIAFEHSSIWLTLAIFLGMVMFACFSAIKRAKKEIRPLIKKAVFVSLVFGTTVVMIYFLALVIGVSPWYDTRYFVSISGMVVGNSMTGMLLALNTLQDGFAKNRGEIEQALMLGATKKQALKKSFDEAFTSAVLPTITSMFGMGIVFLPGMMTGQILAGVSPLLAIEYQIGIMLTILGSVAICVIIFLSLASTALLKNEFNAVGE